MPVRCARQLAPLLFVAFGQIIVGVGILAKPDTEQADKKKKEEKDKVRELHWIDQMLGAPAPEIRGDEEAAFRALLESEELMGLREHGSLKVLFGR